MRDYDKMLVMANELGRLEDGRFIFIPVPLPLTDREERIYDFLRNEDLDSVSVVLYDVVGIGTYYSVMELGDYPRDMPGFSLDGLEDWWDA